MELTRNKVTLRNGVLAFPLAALLLASPWLLEQVGYEFRLGAWVGYIMGGVCVLGGIFMVLDGLKPYRVGVSEHGLSMFTAGLTADLTWDQIEAVVLERDRSTKKDAGVVLVVIPAPGVVTPKTPDYTSVLGERLAFKLIDVKEITGGHAAVGNAMLRYAGTKFTDTTRARTA